MNPTAQLTLTIVASIILSIPLYWLSGIHPICLIPILCLITGGLYGRRKP